MLFNILKKVVETTQKNPKTTEFVFKALQNLANSRQKK